MKRFAAPMLTLLAWSGCVADPTAVPDWNSLANPQAAAEACVFTSGTASWLKGNCSPVLSGQGDAEGGGLGPFDVEVFDIFRGTTYFMAYTQVGEGGDMAPRSIAVAASLDGITWDRFPDNPVLDDAGGTDSLRVGCTAMRYRDATLHLWAMRGNPSRGDEVGIFHASSSDGLSWEMEDTPLAGVAGAAGERFVQAEGCAATWNEDAQTFDLWFSGVARYGKSPDFTFSGEIARARSRDGVEVEFTSDAPFEPSGEGFDAEAAVDPSVSCAGELCLMAYLGWDQLISPGGGEDFFISGDHQVGLASSVDEGRTFTRSGLDLSTLAFSEEGTDVLSPRAVFGNGWVMLFFLDNFGLQASPELGVALVATTWPPTGIEEP